MQVFLNPILSKFHSYFGKQTTYSESWGPVENFFDSFLIFSFSKSKERQFGRRKSIFCPYERHYDSPLPTLSKMFAFFSKKCKYEWVIQTTFSLLFSKHLGLVFSDSLWSKQYINTKIVLSRQNKNLLRPFLYHTNSG